MVVYYFTYVKGTFIRMSKGSSSVYYTQRRVVNGGHWCPEVWANAGVMELFWLGLGLCRGF
jgi:hypothetical protein